MQQVLEHVPQDSTVFITTHLTILVLTLISGLAVVVGITIILIEAARFLEPVIILRRNGQDIPSVA